MTVGMPDCTALMTGPTRAWESSGAKTIPLTRYLGVVRLSAGSLGSFDVLVDSTGTIRNLHCLGIVCRGAPTKRGRQAIEFLAREYECIPEEGTARLIFLPR